MKIKKQEIITYMIDVLGYPESDVEDYNVQELAYMLTPDEIAECYQYTNQ